MEINRAKSSEGSDFSKRLENFVSEIKTKEGTFFNMEKNMFEAIECMGPIESPIVTMNCRKSFLSYKFTFDIVYVNAGRPYRKNSFFTDSLLGGTVGLIPQYIVDVVNQGETTEICFNANDLDTLFNEQRIDICETKNWSDIVEECAVNHSTCIKLIDRVFYTRAEYYDGNRNQIGVIHIALLNGLPTDLSSKLYPVGEVEYLMQQ